jgi:hypothetical protein
VKRTVAASGESKVVRDAPWAAEETFNVAEKAVCEGNADLTERDRRGQTEAATDPAGATKEAPQRDSRGAFGREALSS